MMILEIMKKASAGHGKIVAVAAVTIANGCDNISIYTPLFATRAIDEIAVIAIVFALMTALWLGAAHYLVNHPRIGAPIRRYGHRVVPFVSWRLEYSFSMRLEPFSCFTDKVP